MTLHNDTEAVVVKPRLFTNTMKVFKLIVHQKNFSGEDLILNPKDFPAVRLHDIVEIYHPEDEFSRLLLQVTALKEDLQQKDTISVEQSIATTFQLRTYTDVNVSIVDPATVALDSVELTFKDQYLGRSEMWRLKNSLVHTCVYINKKIEFCGGNIRCQVYEMWAGGERVACGVITDVTKVVFRSSTSMVYLFIQMSSEMWDFDIHGDLYFEKAVNGFLAELFAKWKKNGSNHEVTIVLFSRSFYKAQGLDEFPEHMRDCLQQDYRGKFYEDFYRVVVQNERYDDWSNILTQLRRVFVDYQKMVLECHILPGVIIPKAVNSTAARGNFLEVLNMSLNVFEKHYLDRSFDRTGQLSVVITPGVGVFEVDRELTNITKQRIIDNGVGSDLVCVGEQPLHAVPLLKFHNKDSSVSVGDDYSMPHWINLSFYSSNKKVGYSTFVPRIKLPSRKYWFAKKDTNGTASTTQAKLLNDENPLPSSIYDYDAYDAKVFHLPTSASNRCSLSLQRASARNKKSSNPDVQTHSQRVMSRKMSDPDIRHASLDSEGSNGSITLSKSAAIAIPSHSKDMPQYSSSFGALNIEGKSKMPPMAGNDWNGETTAGAQTVGTDGSPYEHNPLKKYLLRPGRALINPFDPSHVTIKLTSNRRRWTHIFPKGPTGVLIQQHHYQAIPTKSTEEQPHEVNSVFGSPNPMDMEMYSSSMRMKSQASHTSSQDGELGTRFCMAMDNERRSSTVGSSTRTNRLLSDVAHQGNRSLTLLWGATGEQEWTPSITTGVWNERDRDFFILELQEYGDTAVGVDWKSLTIPACLPITTDYFPDERSLQNDYVVSDYNLLPDDVNADYAQQRAIYRRPLTTGEVFRELVSQRLAQGFQLIILPPPPAPSTSELQTNVSPQFQSNMGTMSWSKLAESEPVEKYFLSIGRIFHKIALCGSTITVTRYRPRHPYPVKNIHYRYRFQGPDNNSYEVSWVEFTTEKLENYNWNYLDHYICTRGDPDFALQEVWCSQMQSFKFWRFRMYLLPLHHPGTKKISDGSEHCDVYTNLTMEECCNLVDGFLRFMENGINKIRRPNIGKKGRGRREVSTSSTSSFRERLGSNRITELHRPRSGSKVDRMKSEGTANGRASPALDVGDQKPHLLSLDLSQDGDSMHDDGAFDPKPLKTTATFSEILEAMKNSVTGVGFCQHPNLPNLAFVSADATVWLVEHMEGIANEMQAVSIFEEMLKEKLICHASGKIDHPFEYGFYLYYIIDSSSKEEGFIPNGDISSFQNEWIEVGSLFYRTLNSAANPQPSSPTTTPIPDFLQKDLSHPNISDPSKVRYALLYKEAYLDVDIGSKSDREEWGHAKYQSIYKANEAFELVVQWMTSTGAIITDLLQGWARKAQLYSFQLVPVPDDPFALPYSYKSDPLRGPIFLPIDVECLLENKSYLFQEFPEETWEQRLFLFQELIAHQFGFTHCQLDQSQQQHRRPNLPVQHQYVHTTGNMFILIPTKLHPQVGGTPIVNSSRGPRLSNARKVQREMPVPSPHEEYITRHVTGKNKDSYDEERRIGFLWSWNYLVSKRWRYSPNHTLGDENFQNKVLRDFQGFCANDKNRLKAFWDKCWEKLT